MPTKQVVSPALSGRSSLWRSSLGRELSTADVSPAFRSCSSLRDGSLLSKGVDVLSSRMSKSH